VYVQYISYFMSSLYLPHLQQNNQDTGGRLQGDLVVSGHENIIVAGDLTCVTRRRTTSKAKFSFFQFRGASSSDTCVYQKKDFLKCSKILFYYCATRILREHS
jgi:hypothetical protein